MSELITKAELKAFKAFLKNTKLEKQDYNNVDYNIVKEALLLSPFVNERLKLTPPQESVQKNDNGEYYIETEQGNIAFEEKYYPMVSLAVAGGFIDDDSIGFLKEILNKIEQFFNNLKNFSNEEKRIKKSLIDYIENIDTQYLNMRKDIIKIEDKYNNKIVELLFLLPDLTLYFIKFLSDAEVPIRLKNKILPALLYIVLPLDIIPEQFLGPIGMIDDVYVALFVIVELLFNSELSDKMLKKHWPGKTEDFLSLKERLTSLSDLLGTNVVYLIRKNFEERSTKTCTAI